VKSLHAKIGELTLENDFLEGALGKAYPSDLHRLVWLRLLAEHATLRLALRSTDAG
jgi:hypothetical protein